MQDKNLHTDKKFTDRAWREMRALLDEEMPAKDRKKPLIVWWLHGSLAIAALLSALYFFVLLKPEKIKPENKTEIITEPNPIAQLKKEKNIEKNIYTEKTSKFNPNNNAGAVGNKMEKTAYKASALQKENILSDLQVAEIQEVEKGFKNGPIEKPINKEINKTGDIFSENNSLNKRPLINDKTFSKKINVPVLEKLLFQKKKSLKIDPLKADKKTKKHIVYAAVLGVPHTKIKGVSAGYMRTIYNNNKGFSFETGLGYTFISQPMNYIVAEVSTNVGMANDPMFETYNVLHDVSYSNNSFPNVFDLNGAGVAAPTATVRASTSSSADQLHLHYLSVPFQGKYHVDKWFFSGGVQANVLLFAFNNILSGGLLKNGRGITDQQAALESADSFNKRSGDGEEATLSNFDLTATVGTGFQLSDHFGIQLQYNHGLKDIIRINYQTDYNRMLQFTTTYSW